MTLALAIIGTVVAVASFVYTIWRGRNADAVQRSAEARLEREENRREEEIGFLRVEVERQAEAYKAARSAELVGKATGYSGSERGIDFPMQVRNVGAALARDVEVWLAFSPADLNADPRSATLATTRHALGDIVPGDGPSKFTLTQPPPAGGRQPRDGWIVASWTDGNDEHVREIGKVTLFV